MRPRSAYSGAAVSTSNRRSFHSRVFNRQSACENLSAGARGLPVFGRSSSVTPAKHGSLLSTRASDSRVRAGDRTACHQDHRGPREPDPPSKVEDDVEGGERRVGASGHVHDELGRNAASAVFREWFGSRVRTRLGREASRGRSGAVPACPRPPGRSSPGGSVRPHRSLMAPKPESGLVMGAPAVGLPEIDRALMGPHVRPLTVPVNTSLTPGMAGSFKDVLAGEPGLNAASGGTAGVAFSASLHGAGPAPAANCPRP